MIEYEDLTDKQRAKYDDIMSKLPERPYDDSERMIGNIITDLIEGFSGSGKTTLVVLIIRDLKLRGYKVFCCAPTHAAVGVMEEAYGGDGGLDFVGTIHSALGLKLQHNEDVQELVATGKPKTSEVNSWNKRKTYKCDILCCDEASMDSPIMCAHIKKAQEQDYFHVLYIGDSYQLMPVDGDGNHSPVFDQYDPIKLDEVTRQAADSPIIKFSAVCRDKIDYYEGRTNVNNKLSFSDWNNGKEMIKIPIAEVVNTYLDVIGNDAKNAQFNRILSFTNERVNAFNRIVRKKLYGDNADEYIKGEIVVLQAGTEVFSNNESVIIKNISEIEMIEDAPHQFNGSVVDKTTEYTVTSYAVEAVSLDGKREETIYLLTAENRDLYVKWMGKLARLYRKVKADGNYRGAKNGWNVWWELQKKYPEVRYAFASTVHKIQGATLDNVVFDLASTMPAIRYNPSTAFRLIYVAATRAKYTFYFGM